MPPTKKETRTPDEPAYSAARIAKGKPWETGDSFVNAVLVSIWRRNEVVLTDFVTRGYRIEAGTAALGGNALLIFRREDLVAKIVYKGTSVRRVTPKLRVALSTLLDDPSCMEEKTPGRARRAGTQSPGQRSLDDELKRAPSIPGLPLVLVS